jgi:hypothetical protein
VEGCSGSSRAAIFGGSSPKKKINFDLFIIIFPEINPVKNLALLVVIGASYEGVTLYALARVESVMWRHVGFSRAETCVMTESRRLLSYGVYCGATVGPTTKHRVSISRVRIGNVTQSRQSI